MPAGLALLFSWLALLPPREVISERELDLLMSRLADGDRSAFEPLFQSLWPRALSAARRRLEPHAASDAAQATMMKLFARAPEFVRGSPVLPWFYAIAANEIRAILRRAKAQVELDETLASSDDPERSVMDRELRAAVARAIDERDGPSAEAIAALLGEGERSTDRRRRVPQAGVAGVREAANAPRRPR